MRLGRPDLIDACTDVEALRTGHAGLHLMVDWCCDGEGDKNQEQYGIEAMHGWCETVDSMLRRLGAVVGGKV